MRSVNLSGSFTNFFIGSVLNLEFKCMEPSALMLEANLAFSFCYSMVLLT